MCQCQCVLSCTTADQIQSRSPPPPWVNCEQWQAQGGDPEAVRNSAPTPSTSAETPGINSVPGPPRSVSSSAASGSTSSHRNGPMGPVLAGQDMCSYPGMHTDAPNPRHKYGFPPGHGPRSSDGMAMMGGPGMPPQPQGGPAQVPAMHVQGAAGLGSPGGGPPLHRGNSQGSSSRSGGRMQALNAATAAMTEVTKWTWSDFHRYAGIMPTHTGDMNRFCLPPAVLVWHLFLILPPSRDRSDSTFRSPATSCDLSKTCRVHLSATLRLTCSKQQLYSSFDYDAHT